MGSQRDDPDATDANTMGGLAEKNPLQAVPGDLNLESSVYLYRPRRPGQFDRVGYKMGSSSGEGDPAALAKSSRALGDESSLEHSRGFVKKHILVFRNSDRNMQVTPF